MGWIRIKDFVTNKTLFSSEDAPLEGVQVVEREIRQNLLGEKYVESKNVEEIQYEENKYVGHLANAYDHADEKGKEVIRKLLDK